MTTPRQRLGLILAGILCLTIAAYAPVYRAGYVWDDDSWLTGNPTVKDPHGLPAIWTSVPRMQYYPLTFTAFWLEHRAFGLEPFGYHLVNVLLHALNACLVALLLRSLRVPGAFWVGALFAVHPVHVESVAWITELKNVLSGCFALAAALAYVRFLHDRARAAYLAALVLFACALLSKTATATLPLALAAVSLWRHWPPRKNELSPLLPFVVLATVLASITIVLEKKMVAVVRPDFDLSSLERVLVACRALLFYPSKLVIPYPLMFNYPRFEVAAVVGGLLPVVAVALIVAGLAALWQRGRRGVAVALLVYAVTIFPALGFIDVYAFRFSFVADHFQYLASIGILALLPQSGAWLLARVGAGKAARFAGAAVLVMLAALTWNQSRAYKDEATLWRDTLAKNPDSWIAHHNLALLRSDAGDLDGAVAEFGEAIRSKPGSAESYNGRGLAYFKQRKLDLALSDLTHAMELDASYPEAYLNRAQVLSALHRNDEAITDFDRFLAFNTGYAPAYRGRGVAHGIRGEDPEALADLTHAIALDPKTAGAYGERAFVLVRLKRYQEALADFDVAARLDPTLSNTFMLRGGLYEIIDGDTVRACGDWKTACDLGECKLFEANCKGR